jgi:ferredoxin-NADP reductase
MLGNVSDADIYVCGPSEFSKTIAETLVRLGAQSDRIHQEAFVF